MRACDPGGRMPRICSENRVGILRDMDDEFVMRKPLPPGATWLVGGNVWHALMADLTRIYRDKPWPPFNPEKPPEELFGASLRHIPRMTGWALAVALDFAGDREHEGVSTGVDAQ